MIYFLSLWKNILKTVLSFLLVTCHWPSKFSLSPIKWTSSELWQNNKYKVMKLLDPGTVVRSQLTTTKCGCRRWASWFTRWSRGQCTELRHTHPSLLMDWRLRTMRLCSIAGYNLPLEDRATFALTHQPPGCSAQSPRSGLLSMAANPMEKRTKSTGSELASECESWCYHFFVVCSLASKWTSRSLHSFSVTGE